MPQHIMMGVSLLHKCNFNCEHCGYIYIGDAEDHIIKPGYRLTWDQLNTVISDCRSIKDTEWTMNFTGGEPTLWEEGDRRFIDVLLQVARAGISPTFNTNGSYFDDYDRCCDFFRRYTENANLPLIAFISIDKFHKNYDQEKGRAKSLDNIVKMAGNMPEDKKKLFGVHVITIVTNDPDSSLPQEMKDYYKLFRIGVGDFPMLKIGKAKKLTDQLPETSDIMTKPQEGFTVLGSRSLTLVGDDYYVGNKNSGKLGHMSDLFAAEARA